jgi:hypothetical protein
MKKIFLGVMMAFIIAGCNSSSEKNTAATKTKNLPPQQQTKQPIADLYTMPPLTDTGQQYFQVRVWKNDSLLAGYEGDWPIAAYADNNFNLQMAASERMLKISHFLVLYFNSPGAGTFPIVPSGNEKGKPTLIFTPEKEGSYGIGISAEEGTVNISAYSEKKLSGTIEAKGKDENGNEVLIKANFINIKNNNLSE